MTRQWVYRRLTRLMPSGSFWGNMDLTAKGRSWVRMQAARAAALVLIAVGAGLVVVFESRIPAAFGGTVIGIGITVITTSKSAHIQRITTTRTSVEDLAKFDFLHARLNQLARQVGAPVVNLTLGEQDAAVRVRMERIAHFSALEDHRPQLQPDEPGLNFWTSDAYGA